MKNLNLFRSVFIAFCLLPVLVKAQDSLSLFQNYKNQYNSERTFKQNIFYNPANRSDYSSSSFSELSIHQNESKDKIFRPTHGSGNKNFGVGTSSFQKLNQTKTIWGRASYENLTIKNQRWNENLDFDRVAPYIGADSVGGDIDLERYQFMGGYHQKFNKVDLGIQVGYKAQLGSRSRDPRLKSTTSDLTIDAGVNYNFYKEFDAGLFVQGEKYTQNTSVRFASLLGQPLVYQMNGFGNYNYFFSGGAKLNSMIFEELSYKVGGQIRHKKGQDFYLFAQIGQSDLLKSYRGTSNRYFDIADLKTDGFEIEGAKFFTLNDHRLGIKANYVANQTTGVEYGYTNNTSVMTLLYKRKSYKKDAFVTSFSFFYELTKDNFSLAVTPYYRFQEVKELRINPTSGQKFEYNTYGVGVDYKYKLADNQVISLQGFYDFQSVATAKNALEMTASASINDWITNDFNYLASDVQTVGGSIRYDVKLQKMPTLFAQASYSQAQIQHKNNTYTSFTLGITF